MKDKILFCLWLTVATFNGCMVIFGMYKPIVLLLFIFVPLLVVSGYICFKYHDKIEETEKQTKKNNKYKKEIEALKLEMEKYKTDFDNQKKKYDSLKNGEAHLESININIEEYEKEIENLKIKDEKYKADLEKQKQKIQVANEKIRNYKETIDELKEKVCDYEEKLSAITQKDNTLFGKWEKWRNKFAMATGDGKKKVSVIDFLNAEIDRLQKELDKLNEKFSLESNKFQAKCDKLNEQYQAEVNRLQTEYDSLNNNYTYEISKFTIDDNITSEEYKSKYNMLVLKEKEMIKSGEAVTKETPDKSGTKRQIENDAKQLLRCFNSEMAAILLAITVKNIDSSKNKIIRAFETLNKLFTTDKVFLSKEFLEIKLEQADLMYAFQYQKEQERLQQKAIREQMVEEEKIRREIEKEKAKIEKEEKQFRGEITKLMGYMQKSNEIEKQLYIDKIRELEEKLKMVESDKENVLEREQNTRAGYVYVISNIGSFGDDIYKIGMTRRLEPMDRVKELGDASVPFEFDVHAMIFSEDAPALETILHNTFKDNQVNKVNPRKEFFKVKLDDIEKVVKENYNATVTFTKVAEAAQYRESLRLAEAVAV